MEIGDRVVFTMGHYQWLESAGLWRRRYGNKAGRLNVVGVLVGLQGQGKQQTCRISWEVAGITRLQSHFGDRLEPREG